MLVNITADSGTCLGVSPKNSIISFLNPPEMNIEIIRMKRANPDQPALAVMSLPYASIYLPSLVNSQLLMLAIIIGNMVKEITSIVALWKIQPNFTPIGTPKSTIPFQKLFLLICGGNQSITIPNNIFKTSIAQISYILKVVLLFLIVCFGFSSRAEVNKQELMNMINLAEKKYQIPEGLLVSIAKVESKFSPYALNFQGRSVVAATNKEAKTKIIRALEEGETNIDIGVMQLNYRWHANNFASIDEMLDPKKNIEYAAELLASLYEQHSSWQKAVRYYHSATPYHHRKYSRKVIISWLSDGVRSE